MVKRGDVWYVDFNKLEGNAIQKKRPALVIQNNLGNKYGSLTIVVAIQNDPNKNLPVFAKVPAGTAGLKKDSIVNCSVISSIPNTLLGHKIGALPAALLKDVEKAMKASLALP